MDRLVGVLSAHGPARRRVQLQRGAGRDYLDYYRSPLVYSTYSTYNTVHIQRRPCPRSTHHRRGSDAQLHVSAAVVGGLLRQACHQRTALQARALQRRTLYAGHRVAPGRQPFHQDRAQVGLGC